MLHAGQVPRRPMLSVLPVALMVASIVLPLASCTDQSPTPNDDKASRVVGPEGGVVVTPSGFAGVQIPPGAIDQQVTVTVTLLPTPQTPGDGPLPTTLAQYPLYYEVSTDPVLSQLSDTVRVGICQLSDPANPLYPPEAIHSRLRLAHTVGSSIEILEPVGVSDFLQCAGASRYTSVTRAPGWRGTLASLLDRASAVVRPTPLYAAHGGLGGKTKRFSPFAAVDPQSGAVSGVEFPIAATAVEEEFGGVAFDGVNYLVSIQSRNMPNQSTVEAQLVSPSGALVGSPVVVPGRTGDPARIAFDGTNYLMTWGDFTNASISIPILGQFVSKAGTLVGVPFTVVPGTTNRLSVSAMVYGGAQYFVAYARRVGTDSGSFNFATFGRIVSPSGFVNPELALSSGLTSAGFIGNVAFDGASYLTVFTDGSTVKGRFVSVGGGVGQEVTIVPASSLERGGVTVAFNGTNYLVTLARKTSSSQGSDALAQLVSPGGTRIGGLISIATDPVSDEFPSGVVASGSNFIVSYLDNFSVVGGAQMRARFVSGAGALLGAPITIAVPSGGKVPVGVIALFDGSRYFALLLRGVQSTSDPSNVDLWTEKDVFGKVLTIPPP